MKLKTLWPEELISFLVGVVQSVKFAIAEQEYLELLETSQTKKALAVLRSKLAPLNHDADRLHQLSR